MTRFGFGMICGCVVAALLLFAGNMITVNQRESAALEQPAPGVSQPVYDPDTVNITALPPLLTLRAADVPFEGRAELPIKFSGQMMSEIHIVGFTAIGENAHKSVLRIVWEDGGIETFPAGTADLRLSPTRRAKQIIAVGYCMHERHVFKDSARKGTMSWEIRYAAVP